MSDNELIAEFMGLEHREETAVLQRRYLWTDGYRRLFHPVSKLRFDTSWDWLMPVVEKIEKLYSDAFPSNEEFVRRILAKENPLDGPYMDVVGLPLSTSISEVHKAVVDFIKWYNQTKQQ